MYHCIVMLVLIDIPDHTCSASGVSGGLVHYGTETQKFLKDRRHRLNLTSGESRAYSFLIQRFSAAVQ